MSESKEIVKEMLAQGLMSPEDAEKQLAQIEKRETKTANALEAVKQAAKSASVPKKDTGAKTDVEQTKKTAVVNVVKPSKRNASPNARGGSESVGAYAARLYGEELELSPNTYVDVQELVDGINAKKIKEKAFDLVRFLRMGIKLSCYTNIGLKELQRVGKMPLQELCSVMESGTYGTRYSDGTARSQSQQVHSLFRVFGLIDKQDNLIENSPVWGCIRAFAAGEHVSVLRRRVADEAQTPSQQLVTA